MDVSVRDLKNGLSAHLARVRKGERLTVTLRGRPVAEISPPTVEATLGVEERLRRMAEAGDLILPCRSPRDLSDFEPARPTERRAKRGKPLLRLGDPPKPLSASEIILRDRG